MSIENLNPDPSQLPQAGHLEEADKADQIRNAMSVKNLLSPIHPAIATIDDGPVDASEGLESSEPMDIDEVVKTDPYIEAAESTNAALTTTAVHEPVAAVEPTSAALTTAVTELVAVVEPTTPLNPNVRKEQDLITPLSAVSAEDDTDSPNEKVDIPDSDREFLCMNDEHSRCMTGQVTLDLSRKVISDHFGRNKGCTLLIKDWPKFCRKHYQRATYNKQQWQYKKLYLIGRQFSIIERDFPGTTYNIQLKKSEEARFNQYARHVATGMTKEEAAEEVLPKSGRHFEAGIPVLVELGHLLGNNKTMAYARNVVDTIHDMLGDKDTDLDTVPSIEFLPQIPGVKTTPKKTPKARATKSSKTPKSVKTPKDKKTPTSHVSAKGAVKKIQKP